MTRTFFGTDGIRGTANIEPMTAEIALRAGMAAGRHFRRAGYRNRVIIGKDTRLSGYMLEPALTAGFISMGMDVVLTGPIPTPAIGMLVKSMRADLGVMLSASHNRFHDNGIKLFGPDGFKLSDAAEAEIEALMQGDLAADRAAPDALGRAKHLRDDVHGRYMEAVKATFPRGLRLDGLKIVVDCANGAAYKVAPTVLWELGADVVPVAVEPNGFNINDACGSTHPALVSAAVREHKADLGIALDGDADRLLMVDAEGRELDGDQLIAAIAEYWLGEGRLKGGGVVGTVMSNLGLERFLNDLGIGLARTAVGDRYVVEAMRKSGCNLGGEQSGHIVLSDYATTGDGLMAALQILAIVVRSHAPVSEVCRMFPPVPQLLRNVRYPRGADPLSSPAIEAAIAAAEAQLGGGRLLIRKSGTEPLIRVMAEGDDAAAVERIVEELAGTIERAVQAAE
jgi:phosphoglucosamine mutase